MSSRRVVAVCGLALLALGLLMREAMGMVMGAAMLGTSGLVNFADDPPEARAARAVAKRALTVEDDLRRQFYAASADELIPALIAFDEGIEGALARMFAKTGDPWSPIAEVAPAIKSGVTLRARPEPLGAVATLPGARHAAQGEWRERLRAWPAAWAVMQEIWKLWNDMALEFDKVFACGGEAVYRFTMRRGHTRIEGRLPVAEKDRLPELLHRMASDLTGESTLKQVQSGFVRGTEKYPPLPHLLEDNPER